MKTYNEVLTEAAFLSNPLLRGVKFSALKGAFKAIEELTREALVKGTKFVLSNPKYLIAGFLFIDYGVFKGGPMTASLERYFAETFPGHAMAVYNTLAKITVDNKLQGPEVAQLVLDGQKQLEKLGL